MDRRWTLELTRPKVIVGEIPEKVFGDIVEHVLTDKLGVEVVARGVSEQELEAKAVDVGADIILLALKEDDLPPLCERLLSKLDSAVVVGLMSEFAGESAKRRTRIAVFQSGDLEEGELANTILTAMQKSLRQSASSRRLQPNS